MGIFVSKSRTLNVRVVVVGDPGTGKSSLINVAANKSSFLTNVPSVLPPTRLPAADFNPDRVTITIIDTSSSLENRNKLVQELKLADVVVLTYACDQPATLRRLRTFWLPELRRLEVKVPVIVAGCKLDTREDMQTSREQVMSPIMQQFCEIETCIECSARNQIQVSEVFYYAQKAVLYPTAPLLDRETQTLKPQCVRALERIFLLCDHDRDGALSDAELNDFQVGSFLACSVLERVLCSVQVLAHKASLISRCMAIRSGYTRLTCFKMFHNAAYEQIKCFDSPLPSSEIVGVKRVVQDMLPQGEGVNDRGLTLPGFLSLHSLFIKKGRIETTWTVLRKFGYDKFEEEEEDQQQR